MTFAWVFAVLTLNYALLANSEDGGWRNAFVLASAISAVLMILAARDDERPRR